MRELTTAALLVRSVAYGETDVIATLFTESEGKLGVMVRGGRKSTKRVGGALEPFHMIEARIDDRGGELATLREARIVKPRVGIATTLEAIDAAGTALRWVRHVCPPRTPEPDAWLTLGELLDTLDAGIEAPRVALARAGLRLLSDVGYGLDLERCIQCGKECPKDRSSRLDPARGGLVCSACGGGRVVMRAEVRARALDAANRSEEGSAMSAADAEEILAVVNAAMAAHADFDR